MSDFFNVGTGIGNALSGLSGLVNAGVNYNIGQKNFNLQKDNLAYQKEMQQQSWARDDNAIQRRLKYLQAAGLSPTLAAGSAASNAGVVSTSAPQRDSVPDMSGSFSKFADVFSTMMSMKQAQSQVAQTDAQTALINAQADNVSKDGLIKDEAYKEALTKNKYLEEKLVSELARIVASTDNALSNKAYTDSRKLTEDVHRAIDEKDWEYFQKLGEAYRRGPNADYVSQFFRIIELIKSLDSKNSGFSPNHGATGSWAESVNPDRPSFFGYQAPRFGDVINNLSDAIYGTYRDAKNFFKGGK